MTFITTDRTTTIMAISRLIIQLVVVAAGVLLTYSSDVEGWYRVMMIMSTVLAIFFLMR